MFKTLLVLFMLLLLTSCDKMQTVSEAAQVERTIRQEVKRDVKGLTALTKTAADTEYDGFAWRRGETIQIRQRQNGELMLLSEVQAPDIIATAVQHNIPSFSVVRYQQGWLVVFRTYVSSHCQVVYAYAYHGKLDNTPQCNDAVFAEQANGKCQSPINDEWQVFKEWFFAESLVAEGNPICADKVAQGWQAPVQINN